MKVTKYGHCALLIEIDGVRFLTDPGSFSSGFDELTNLDAIVITHEHQDHYHVPSLKAVLAKNPKAIVISNSAVHKLCVIEGIETKIVDEGGNFEVGGVTIEGKGSEHAEIFGEFGRVMNTGYFFGDKLFYPGDAFTNPEREVEGLVVPVAGPWMALKEAIIYARAAKSQFTIPVHDALLSDLGRELHYRLFEMLTKGHSKFVPLENGKAQEF